MVAARDGTARPSARLHPHRQRLQSEQAVVAGPAVGPGGLDGRHAADQLLEHQADLEARQVRASE